MAGTKGGRTHFGEAIGLITLDTQFPRFPGDAGNATSYNFPVRFKAVIGATSKRLMEERDMTLLQPFVNAAKELEKEGVRAISTTCGFLAIFQKEMAEAVDIPVFSSTLMMIPLIQSMLGKDSKVGIITANSSVLTKAHFEGAGVDSVPMAIGGLENGKEFSKLLANETIMDEEKVREEVVSTAKKLIQENPEIEAFLLECSNLPPYSQRLREETGLPIFDLIGFVNLVYNSVVKNKFTGFL